MTKLQDNASFLFIVCIILFALISIFGVWNILSEDVLDKSAMTVSLLAGISILIIIAGKFLDDREQKYSPPTVFTPNSSFTSIRHFTLVVLISSASLLALLGVLAIWEVLSGEILSKSITSITILGFSAFVIVVTCLVREQHKILHKKVNVFSILLFVFVVWLVFAGLLN